MADKSLRFLFFGEDKTVSKAIHGVEKEAGAVATKIGGSFSKLGSTIGGEFGEVSNLVGEGFAKLGEAGGEKLGAKMVATGGAVTGLGAAFQIMGSKRKQAEDQLAAAIKATGGSFEEYKSQIDDTIGRMHNFGRGESDTEAALQKLTSATNSPKEALRQMSLVADLAAAKHISLASASALVSKVYSGSGRVLKEYGITMSTTGDKTANAKQALTELAAKVSGQAKASVDNFSGRIDVLRAKLGDWAANMAQHVGPALTALGPAIMGVGAVLESGLIPKIGAAIVATGSYAASLAATAGAALVSFGSMIVEAAVWAAGMVTSAAVAMAPFLPFILAIGAVAVAGYELVKHWSAIWGGIKSVAVAVWHWAVDLFHNKWTQIIIGIVAPMLWVALHWKEVWGGITTVFNNTVSWIGGKVSALVGFVTGIPGRIAGVAKAVFNVGKNIATGLWNGISGIVSSVGGLGKSLYNAVAQSVNWLIDKIKNWHFTIGAFGISHTFQPFGGIPDIPLMAKGGIVTKPTLAIIGEAGPEAVVPLHAAAAHGFGGGKSGDTYYITLGVMGDAKSAARVLLTELQRLKGSGVTVGLA